MSTSYLKIPYLMSGLIIVLVAYASIYIKLSKKKFTEPEEKALKKFKKWGPILILLSVLNILFRYFINQ